MIREIVHIDEELCDGCGDCVPSCHEGAIQVIDGKARLVSDVLCDGLGACLGSCPQDAIRIERRVAAAFDEAAVAQHLGGPNAGCPSAASPPPSAGFEQGRDAATMPFQGCPSARFARLDTTAAGPTGSPTSIGSAPGNPPSELSQWPVQLRLLPPFAPVFRGARLLLAADCVPVAVGGFQRNMLCGRAIALACPKLDDTSGYLEKLTEIIRSNDLQDVTVAHMEVPCCTGLLALAMEARQRSGTPVRLNDVVVSVRGEVLSESEIPPDVG